MHIIIRMGYGRIGIFVITWLERDVFNDRFRAEKNIGPKTEING